MDTWQIFEDFQCFPSGPNQWENGMNFLNGANGDEPLISEVSNFRNDAKELLFGSAEVGFGTAVLD